MNKTLANTTRLYACTSQISQRYIATTVPLCKNRAGKHRVWYLSFFANKYSVVISGNN